MGLFDHLFKSKSPPGEEKDVEAGTKPAEPARRSEAARSAQPHRAEPSPFLHPKSFVPRGATPLTPPPPKSVPPPGVRKPGPAPATGGPQEIVLTLGDVLSRIPSHYLKAGQHDAKREMRFHISDLSSDIARGRAAVPLSRIAQLMPDIFVKEITADEDTEVRLPLQKLVDQIGLLRAPSHTPAADRTARPAANAPPPTPAVLPLPPAETPASLVTAAEMQVEEVPAAPPAEPHRESLRELLARTGPAVQPKPAERAPVLSTPRAETTVELMPAVEKPRASAVETFAPDLPPAAAPAPPATDIPKPAPAAPAQPEPARIPAETASVREEAPPPVSKTIVSPAPEIPTRPAAEPAPQVPAVAAETFVPPTPRAAPVEPAAFVVPKSSAVEVVPAAAAVPAVEVAPAPAEATAAPVTLAPPESSAAELSDTDVSGEKIQLSLAALLRQCPREIIVGELPQVPDTVRITLPFAPIDRQLVTGHVEISAVRFVAALPFSYQRFFSARIGVKVPIPLEEVFQNLPNPATEPPATSEPPPQILAPAAPGVALTPPMESAPLAAIPHHAPVVPVPRPEVARPEVPEPAVAPDAPPDEPAPARLPPLDLPAFHHFTPPPRVVASDPGAPTLAAAEAPSEKPPAAVPPEKPPAAIPPETLVAMPRKESLRAVPLAAPPIALEASANLSTLAETPSALPQMPGEAPAIDLPESAPAPAAEVPAATLRVASEGPASDIPEPAPAPAPAPISGPAPAQSAPEELRATSIPEESPPSAVSAPATHTIPPPPQMMRPFIVLPPPILGFTPGTPIPEDKPAGGTQILGPELVAEELTPREEPGTRPVEAEEPELPASEIPAQDLPAVETAGEPVQAEPPPEIPPRVETTAAEAPALPRIISIDFSDAPVSAEKPAEAPPASATEPPRVEAKAVEIIETPAEVPVEISVEPSPAEARAVELPVEREGVMPAPAAFVPTEPEPKESAPPVVDTPLSPPPLKVISIVAEFARTEPVSSSIPGLAPESDNPGPLPPPPAVRAPSAASKPVEGAAVQSVSVPAAAAPTAPAAPVQEPAIPPLAILPSSKVAAEAGSTEVVSTLPLALRHLDQEALRAIFMTDDPLDLPNISRLAAQLPGVHACVIATRDQACTGGNLPEGFDLAALLGLAPRVAEAAGRLPIGGLKHFTLYGEQYSVSFFERHGFSLCAVHRSRSFVPGVREKLVAIADELSKG